MTLYVCVKHFLRNDDDIYIDGYRCFKKNRSNIHDRARRGSGGVACLIREELLSVLEVSILDDSVDDILWIKLKVKESGLVICLCVLLIYPRREVRGGQTHLNFSLI